MEKTVLQTYHDFRAAMLSGTDSWTKLLSEDVKLKGPLAETSGKDNFIAVNTPFFNSIQKSGVLKVIEMDNTVITQITTEVKMPNGSNITLEVSEWYEIKEGKIESLKVYFDTFDFRKEVKWFNVAAQIISKRIKKKLML